MTYDAEKVKNELMDGIISRAELCRPVGDAEFTISDFIVRMKARGVHMSGESARRILTDEVDAGRLAVRDATMPGRPGRFKAFRPVDQKESGNK